ncbi:MAG: citrate synthase [Deltaproteobacteria bacterium]|nr:citrate synthase [Deltaproteobacteria bacterium]
MVNFTQETTSATLTIGDRVIELPLVVGTEGEVAIDIRQLRQQTDGVAINGNLVPGGVISFDPGYKNTGSCQSEITYINGEEGILRYRGYNIADLAKKGYRFIDVAMLIIFGELPTAAERANFRDLLTHNELLDEDMRKFFDSLPPHGDPMAILSAAVQCSSLYNPELRAIDPADPEGFTLAAAKLLSKVRTIAAFSYKKAIGQPIRYPNPELDYVRNFLHMMFSIPNKPYHASETEVDALNLFLTLHADHEQNCSTSTVRMVGSSKANLFDSASSGISALAGPLHGGANIAVVNMLEKVSREETTVNELIGLAKSKKIKLPGFGHRLYKKYDPRARIIKQKVDKLLGELNHDAPLFTIAQQLEEIALTDDYFIAKRLYPNVDFYSGIMLRAIGIPVNMFTVMFAMARMAGWIAQWREEMLTPGAAIQRPRQVYTGAPERTIDWEMGI